MLRFCVKSGNSDHGDYLGGHGAIYQNKSAKNDKKMISYMTEISSHMLEHQICREARFT